MVLELAQVAEEQDVLVQAQVAVLVVEAAAGPVAPSQEPPEKLGRPEQQVLLGQQAADPLVDLLLESAKRSKKLTFAVMSVTVRGASQTPGCAI